MRKYTPSGKAPFSSILLLLIGALITGVAVGMLMWAIEHYLNTYLIIVFPILGGALIGFVLSKLVEKGKIRSRLIAALVSILSALIIFATYQTAGYYLSFRTLVRDDFINEGYEITDEELDEIIDSYLQDEVEGTGVIGYMKLIALEGFDITSSRYGVERGTTTLQGDIVYGYWGLELLVMAGFAVFLAGMAAGQPFDEQDDAWYGPEELHAVGTKDVAKQLNNALKDGQFGQAGQLVTLENIEYPRTEVRVRRGTQSEDVYLASYSVNKKGTATKLRSGLLSPAEFSEFDRNIRTSAVY